MPGPTSAERGQAVRRRLLDAAAELIPELGWSGVSTRVLAERAAVTPGLVHYHFASLRQLLTEAVLRTARQLLEQPLALLDQAPDAATGIDRLFGVLDAYTGTDPTSLLLVEAYLAATRDAALRTELATLIGEFRAELAGWLRARGQGASSEAIAVVLAAAIDGVMLHRGLDPAVELGPVATVLQIGRAHV